MNEKRPCRCKCHQVENDIPENMDKWTLIKKIEKYGRLKYATNRNRHELIDILYDLSNAETRKSLIVDGIIYLQKKDTVPTPNPTTF